MASNIQQSVLKIIAEQALVNVSDISLDHTLSDLGIDSLALVESIFAIEETFDIDVPFNANEPGKGNFDISTVASIVGAVENLVAEQRK
ncbi:MAG: phosphopantetheine-binding protein [Paracoccaceae bacterium]